MRRQLTTTDAATLIKVEGQRDGWLRERGDELVDKHVAEAEQGRDVDQVLEAGQRRLTGQVRVVGRVVGDELEDGVGAKTRDRTISGKVWSMRRGSRGSWRAAANCNAQ